MKEWINVRTWSQWVAELLMAPIHPKVGLWEIADCKQRAIVKDGWRLIKGRFRGPQAQFLHANKWVERTPLAK